MRYGRIAGVDKPVSRIGQGLVMINTRDLEGGFALLDAVFETGVTLFDSSSIYGGGDCDRGFGRWVASRGVRDRVVMLDKCAHHNADRRRVTPFDITADLHDCLARLKFDTIDLFVMHRDDPDVPVGPIVEAMNEHIRSGLIGAYGGSNWTRARIAEADAYAAAHHLAGFAVSSPHYSLAHCVDDPWGNSVTLTGPDADDDRRWYVDSQMPLAPWSSLCGGFFSGRFTRRNLDEFTSPADRRCVRCYCSEENFRRLDRARRLADEIGCTVPQIALAYVLCGPLNAFPLVASHTPEQARDNAAATDVRLTEEQMAWLDLRRD
jgi:aryl-alcohol dehydrogenase-like predicted oxidoreductase